MKYNIVLIGAGNIGSRHLQGLKKVNFPLNITVVDPSSQSLNVAKDRWEQIASSVKHHIIFNTYLNSVSPTIDLAIIATNSNIRRKAIEELLSKSALRYLILEKLLFQKKEDYFVVDKLLKKKKVKAWVNCSMRVTPFYSNLKKKVKDKKIICLVNGSQYGFITNSIHFIDYVTYLSDIDDFTLDTTLLDKKPINSKRMGFLEFNGTLIAYFKNGSVGIFNCYPIGKAPIVVEIISRDLLAMANESNRKTWVALPPEGNWQESKEMLAYQSDITNLVVEKILKAGKCDLPSYQQSSKLHLTLLEGLRDHLNQTSIKKYDYYPFT